MKLLIQQDICDQYSEDRLILINHFTKYCTRALNIDDDIMIYVINDRKKYGVKTTGAYYINSNEVFIYAKNRAFVDVLRSISHELVHVKQHQDGRDKKLAVLHFDSELEDEANMCGMSLLNAYSEVMGHDIIYEN